MANIIDDHSMKISHVIRGEEWLPSAPLHVMLYKAFGWEAPIFAHCPLLLRPDGKGKLSKRDGDRLGFPVFPIDWTSKDGEKFSGYREQGYLPEAFINMLAFLGWNPGTTQELFTLEEMIDAFSIERISKSGAKFDADKTKWFQQQYLRKLSGAQLAKMLLKEYPEPLKEIKSSYLEKVCSLMKERATFVGDIYTDGHYLFENPTHFDSKTIRKKWKATTEETMKEWAQILEHIPDFNASQIELEFKQFLEKKQLGFGAVLQPFRLVLTGKSMGPSMFETAALLGKTETLKRMQENIPAIINLKEE